jgi:hypothetical protein
MSYFLDMGTVTLVAAGPHVRAVGWLDSERDFPKGASPAGFTRKLQEFVDDWSQSATWLGFPLFLGGHSCEFCRNASGAGDFGVPSGTLLFVAPTLILHYVEAHEYLPPLEFVRAVLKSPPPRTWRYRWLVNRFRNLPMSSEDEQRIADAVRAWTSKVTYGRAKQALQPTSGARPSTKDD